MKTQVTRKITKKVRKNSTRKGTKKVRKNSTRKGTKKVRKNSTKKGTKKVRKNTTKKGTKKDTNKLRGGLGDWFKRNAQERKIAQEEEERKIAQEKKNNDYDIDIKIVKNLSKDKKNKKILSML